MTTETDKKTRAPGNRYDEDITKLFELQLPTPRTDVYEFLVHDLRSDDEHYMANAFHQQYVAVEGRSAIAQLINTRIGDISTHASHVMGHTMVNIEQIESAASLGRLGRRFQDYNNKLIDQTARHMLETNAIAVRTMQEDMRRSPYPPPPPQLLPPRPKRKGLIQLSFELLFGEL